MTAKGPRARRRETKLFGKDYRNAKNKTDKETPLRRERNNSFSRNCANEKVKQKEHLWVLLYFFYVVERIEHEPVL